uniref:Uncharacterized protein n=1 Tax=Rhizophora mucronata TaxID=61149 RepID=A0A2P2LMK7_RHIMU
MHRMQGRKLYSRLIDIGNKQSGHNPCQTHITWQAVDKLLKHIC